MIALFLMMGYVEANELCVGREDTTLSAQSALDGPSILSPPQMTMMRTPM
jgi:hypothetical protein